MDKIGSFPVQLHSSEPKLKGSKIQHNTSLEVAGHLPVDPYTAYDDKIPTIDYSLLFSHDPKKRSLALEYLRQACQEYGFFYVILLNSCLLLLFKVLLKGVSSVGRVPL